MRYGGSGTIHRTGEINIELDGSGQVVSVWFRCMPLPFTQRHVDGRRAQEMRSMYSDRTEPMKQINAIEFVDDEPRYVPEPCLGPQPVTEEQAADRERAIEELRAAVEAKLLKAQLQLDTTGSETARAVHRVVRAMHDGECPNCHFLFESMKMRAHRTIESSPLIFDMKCPVCNFTITTKEQDEAMKLFAPVMEKNVAVFDQWRKTLV